ncbi:hypothetical protein [Salinigranum halophilum]|jgi:uncharacterized membrane protein YuzA (DUF378 family)|uniref:hypothetical protein n=1 Tax=Salinigranum halophilum TaxID=2565931 RepID=UPI0010A7654A|nr:hypothetical protein [Salinigranum halophilum]
MTDGYRGVFGAFPYAFRQSRSLLFRSYVLVGALAAGAVTLLFGAGLVVLIAQTAAIEGGSLTLSRAFYVVVGLFVVAPLVAPVLFVARRHRRREGADARYDLALSLAGYLFIASLYVGLVITVPADQQSAPPSAVAPLVETLYALPQVAGVVPPLVASGLILAVHRLLR